MKQLYEKLAALESERWNHHGFSKRHDEIMAEKKEIKIKIAEVMNSKCPVFKGGI